MRALHLLEIRLVRIEPSTVRRLHDRRKSQRSAGPEIPGEREKTPRPSHDTGEVRYTGDLSVRLDDAEWSEEQEPETHRDSRPSGKDRTCLPAKERNCAFGGDDMRVQAYPRGTRRRHIAGLNSSAR